MSEDDRENRRGKKEISRTSIIYLRHGESISEKEMIHATQTTSLK